MSQFAVLSGYIQQKAQELEQEYSYAMAQAQQAETTNIDAYWIAAGFGLQGFYTGLEKIFEQVARRVDGSSVQHSERWHQELLDQMQLEVPGVRPPVIAHDTYKILKAVLAFRHVVRNNYTHALEPSLIAQNIEMLPLAYEQVLKDLKAFQGFLESS
ncbi:hypothetical protein IQ260_05555 [Leptolyngbya cf. ectocarpi LEGE 11479]|uniref:HepT-like domain-containing protein n=1 Tax=Leptolyngbya cf. ectocarpi LEGE 11479 TaxID=1828722 RepID=A0A928WZD0_LEPEC|nr:hypothetical protein [Leptolyngbya ectocarpi]MBE9066112.1 hypothetical protein [Leptolyngbya cf. ectocarpi LEGE 11479]